MKNKALAALIVGGLPKKGEKDEDSEEVESEPEENVMGDEEVAADDIITAIKEDDPAALVDALKAFMECCGYGEEKETSEET